MKKNKHVQFDTDETLISHIEQVSAFVQPSRTAFKQILSNIPTQIQSPYVSPSKYSSYFTLQKIAVTFGVLAIIVSGGLIHFRHTKSTVSSQGKYVGSSIVTTGFSNDDLDQDIGAIDTELNNLDSDNNVMPTT